jgi:mono/diheme cytochrome c family protein
MNAGLVDRLVSGKRPPHPVLLPEGRRDDCAAVADSLAPWGEGWGEGGLWRCAGRYCTVLATLAVLTLAGCDVSMTEQPKYNTYVPSRFWNDGASARPIPANTVAQGDLRLEAESKTPPPANETLLARGEDRFNAFCSPCHGLSGYGDGMIVQRGFPAPPSYHSDDLRTADAQHFFDVITNGYGFMYSYADRVSVEDRWAIVAYIRALQLSQNSNTASVPDLAEKIR